MWHSKALVLAVLGVGLVLALPKPDSGVGQFLGELQKAEVAQKDVVALSNTIGTIETTTTSTAISIAQQTQKLTRWQKAKAKFASLKRHCHLLFDKIKSKFHDIANIVHGITESLSNVKKNTLKLIAQAEKLYKKIVMKGKNVFHEFDRVTKDLSKMLKVFKKDGGEFYRAIKGLLGSLKREVVEIGVSIAKGELDLMKNDWSEVVLKTQIVGDHFERVFKDLFLNYESVKQGLYVTIGNVKKDVKSIATDFKVGLEELKASYREIVVSGKQSYGKFKELYHNLIHMFDDLKPLVGDVLGDVKAVLVEMNSRVDKNKEMTLLQSMLLEDDNDNNDDKVSENSVVRKD